ncbi:MAG: MCE family protein [Planctomycetales bacterium]|nr:MCE family protein [Planctomycetales bacterium]NIM07605.1 MCE family protein [Planctomycetales bacterium]NIN07111.1 MCE family protein [Planctomycetales bacterium]NIN76205.1 MCE family protein [Planctomycetales bacterium]NIO33427.1 MCE family protein [Planctomycetales bacterium]
MEERVLLARVGIVVIAALLLIAILIVWFGDFPTPLRRGNVLEISFPTAPGVMEGTPVRKSGILIGRVEQVQFDPESSGVLVTVRIDEEVKLRKHEICRIDSGSLLGDAVLQFIPGEEPSDQLIQDGDRLAGVSAGGPLEMARSLEGDIHQTLNAVANASNQIAKLARQMDGVFQHDDEEQLQRVVDKAEQALDHFSQAMTQFTHLMDGLNQDGKLQESFQQLPQLIEETRGAMARLQEVGEAADRNLQNVEGLTGPLGQRGEQIAQRIDNGLASFETVMHQLVTFTEQINQSDGTLGQLVNNPQLYHNMNSALENIQRLSTDLRPILNDIRVFSDKIARDPGQLGVRGALQRSNDRTKYPNFRSSQPPLDWRETLRPPADWRQEPLPEGAWHIDLPHDATCPH